SRRARGTPRVWIPTMPSFSVPALRSSTSWAMRVRARRRAAASITWTLSTKATNPTPFCGHSLAAGRHARPRATKKLLAPGKKSFTRAARVRAPRLSIFALVTAPCRPHGTDLKDALSVCHQCSGWAGLVSTTVRAAAGLLAAQVLEHHLHVLGQRRHKGEPRPGAGMAEAQAAGVEALPLQGPRRGPAPVDPVPQHRMAQVGQMHPDLVGAACLQDQAHVRVIRKPLQHLVLGDGRPPPGHHGHALAMHRVAP